MKTELFVLVIFASFNTPFVSEASAQGKPACTNFTVVTQDNLNNINEGLSADDAKWFQKKIAKKYPGACYAVPASTVPVLFRIVPTPAVYHGTQVVQQRSTQSDPVNGTATDQNGNTSQVSGTVQRTTTTSTAVPYSVDYNIWTLSVERRRSDGTFDVAHKFQQAGIYYASFGLYRGRARHPIRAVIEDAAKWVNDGGLTDPKQSVFQTVEPSEKAKQ